MQISDGSTPDSTRFPTGGKRFVFYLLHDSRGEVDDYIPYKLRELRQHADHIFVIVNGTLTAQGHAELQDVADTVWERENVGYDVWGYKTALEHVGYDALSDYDEIVLMNYTWFGPVRPFGPVFDRMGEQALDFWGMTDHDGAIPNPYTGVGEMHRHIQSHWIAVRKRLFLSEEWRAYWDEMPMITHYTESVLHHESRFTHHFHSRGFRFDVAFPVADFPTEHPALMNPELLMDAGCPVLKRRPFFHYPAFLDRHAVIGRWTLKKAEAYGYPMAKIWQNLARSVPPKTLNIDAGMLEVLPDEPLDPQAAAPQFRIAAILHVFYEDMIDELLDRVAMLPGQYDVFITTTDERKSAEIRAAIDRRADRAMRHVEVRILPSNRGRDLSAFFIACRDVLRSGEYDLVVKLHSKKTVQLSYNEGRMFKRQQIENVMSSAGYVTNVLRLFEKEPGLGVVYPPMIHIGYPTMGRGWFANREPTEKLAKKLGIRVPMDEVSPLAPFGCMWIARPEALRLLSDVEWEYEEYAAPSDHRDGSLAHVQERIISYAAGELGYHTRTIANFEHASLSHVALEYKLDQMASTTPGYPLDQIQFLHRAGWMGHGGIVAITRMYMRLHRPRAARALLPAYHLARRAFFLVHAFRHRMANRPPADDVTTEGAP